MPIIILRCDYMTHPDFRVKLRYVCALESMNIWKNTYVRILKIYIDWIPITYPINLFLFIYCKWEQAPWRYLQWEQRQELQGVHIVCAWWRQTHPTATASPDRWSPTTAFQPSEEWKNICQEQEQWLLFSPVLSDPLTHCFWRPWKNCSGRHMMGTGGHGDVRGWWPEPGQV